MYDLKMDGRQPAPKWFWISLALLIIATMIFYIVVNNDRRGQKNTGNQTELIQSKQIKILNEII